MIILKTFQLLVSQLPAYWLALTTAFFALGLLYAYSGYRTSKRRLSRALRQQSQLGLEHKAALNDRKRRQYPIDKSPLNSDSNRSVASANGTKTIASSGDYFSSTYASSGSVTSAQVPSTSAHTSPSSAAEKKQIPKSTTKVRPNPWTDYRN